jgi:hypothetical protein
MVSFQYANKDADGKARLSQRLNEKGPLAAALDAMCGCNRLT